MAEIDLNNSKIGALLAEYRQAKHMRVEDLASRLKISKATYSRLMKNQSTMRVPVFFQLLDAMRVEFSELAPRINRQYFPLTEALHHLSQTSYQVSHDQLTTGHYDHALVAAEEKRLQAKYATHHNPGFKQVLMLLHVFTAELDQDLTAARANAEALYQELIAYDTWNVFEYRLIISISAYLPFDRLKFIFNKVLYQKQNDEVSFPEVSRWQLDILYRQFLACAIQSRDVHNIRLAQQWIQQRFIVDTNLGFYALKRFCTVVTLMLAGDRTAAAKAYANLLTKLRVIINLGAEKTQWEMQLQSLWEDLNHFHIDQLAHEKEAGPWPPSAP